MEWALFRAASTDTLRVLALSAVWNARSWRPALSGLPKRDPSNDNRCCAPAYKFTGARVLVDHHCNASRAPECGAARKATLAAGVYVRPKLGCP